MAQICLSVELSCLFALLCYKVTCSLFRSVKLLFTRLWPKIAYLLLVRGTKLLIRRIACPLCCITLYIFNLKHVFYLFINYLSCPFAECVRLIFPFSFLLSLSLSLSPFSSLLSPFSFLNSPFSFLSSLSLLFSSRSSFLILFSLTLFPRPLPPCSSSLSPRISSISSPSTPISPLEWSFVRAHTPARFARIIKGNAPHLASSKCK